MLFIYLVSLVRCFCIGDLDAIWSGYWCCNSKGLFFFFFVGLKVIYGKVYYIN